MLHITRRTVALAAAALFAQSPGHASDHLDTAAVIADPAADIGDLYAWMSADGKQLNLAMTIVGKKFSDHVRYEFHVDSGRGAGRFTATTTIACEFLSATAPSCEAGDADRLRGDASGIDGITGERRRFRVFAGLRDDPFFNNVRGTRAALNVAAAAIAAGAPRDAAGCPRFDDTTVARIRDEWRRTDGHAGTNLLAGWTTAALIVSVDLDVVDRGGQLLGVWAATTVRAAPPGHPPLTAGTAIDRMGRALTGNALIGTFESEEASDRRKSQYNQARPDEWQSFASDLAATLAVYDAFDGICGNQWLTAGNVPASRRYSALARMLADDRLWIDARTPRCARYLAVELAENRRRSAAHDCGGRTPDVDAVDVFRSLLVDGRAEGTQDGVARDDREHSSVVFPFLAAP